LRIFFQDTSFFIELEKKHHEHVQSNVFEISSLINIYFIAPKLNAVSLPLNDYFSRFILIFFQKTLWEGDEKKYHLMSKFVV
jgi:hypothetical protein